MTKTLFYIYFIITLILAVISLQHSTEIKQTKERLNSLQSKLFQNIIKCPKCLGTDITERSDNPKSLPWVKTMDEIASRSKEWNITTKPDIVNYFNHYLTCNTCGYQVSYNLPY